MKSDFQYYRGGLTSKGHTPVYKMHKYFARRPHNVFRSLVEHYSEPNDLVFDPFGGGGVTIIEGLTTNRRVISSDINPIASFVQYCQALNISPATFSQLAEELNNEVQNEFSNKLVTKCSKCNNSASVRWFEHAYIIKCPCCNLITDLSNSNMSMDKNSKKQPGKYNCKHCKCTFQAANVKRIGSIILNIRFKCNSCGIQDNKQADNFDQDMLSYFTSEEQSIVHRYKLYIPEEDIPEFWDRQQEDCLHRKGFKKFRDLFTKRNLIINSYYFSVLERLKPSISDDLYMFMLFNISSLLRYTNNMNFSTTSWMDGRPVAWAKHAYWTPNQFIEVNPIEYFDNRVKAALQGLKDQRSRFKNKSHSIDVETFLKGNKDYCVVCEDSSNVSLKENSVDLVLTDPPYGSNVQYSELCAFWYVWIKDSIPFKFKDFFFEEEAVVHRKTKYKEYTKTFSTYNDKLKDVFVKCYNVLKPGGNMVFTFNNKNIKAWFSLVKAAIDAGFYLDSKGIIYQEPIDAYRDTAHQRYDGTPQGDYIYTFRKLNSRTFEFKSSLSECIDYTINELLTVEKSFTFHEFMVRLFANSTFLIINKINEGESEDDIIAIFSAGTIEEKLNNNTQIEMIEKKWIKKDTFEYEHN